MRTALIFSFIFALSMSATAQSRWGESFAQDHKVDVVSVDDIERPLVDAINWFNSSVATNNSYSYGMLGVDGDLAYAAANVDHDKTETLPERAIGELPPRPTDPMTLAGVTVIRSSDIHGSILVNFTYEDGKLIKVTPENKTEYSLEFTPKGTVESNGTQYWFSWTYKGNDKQHYFYARAPK